MTCTKCGTTSSKQYYGMRKGTPVCLKCYHAERKLARPKKTRNKVYSLWGGE